MGLLDVWRSRLVEARCGLSLAPHLHEFALPDSPYSIVRALERRIAERPHGLALSFEDERYTFRDLDRRCNQFAAFFRERGVAAGDVVALMMDNRPAFLFAVLALARLRAVGALINTHLVGGALTHAINVCKPRALLLGAEHVEAVRAVADVLSVPEVWTQGGGPTPWESIDASLAAQPDAPLRGLTPPRSRDVALYIFTSGTTGLPKPALIRHKRWLTFGHVFGHAIFDATPRDTLYVTLPLYHSNAMLCALGAALVTGASVALRRKFSASQFWDDVRKYDATLFVYIGELCRYLMNAPASADDRRHRIRACSGNGLRPDVWQPFQERFGIPVIREFYGSTEGNAGTVNFEGRRGMIGRIKPGQRLVRCDPATGELWRNDRGLCEQVAIGERGILLAHVNPLVSFDGYLDRAATRKKLVQDVRRVGDRWFDTGDLMQLHEGGWLSFADRVGDTFRWKGENVSTHEVGELLNQVRGVLESNVFGVEVPGREGRAGMASLTVDAQFDLQQLAAHVCSRLAAFQRPYFVRLQTAQRVTGTFKHQKASYREEGFDPEQVADPLYLLEDGRYLPLDAALHQRVLRGEVGPR